MSEATPEPEITSSEPVATGPTAPLDLESDAALRAICEKAFAGDLLVILDDISSEAYVDLLHIVAAFPKFGAPESYEIEPLALEGEEPRFILRVKNTEGEVESIASLRRRKDRWQIAGIKIPGVRD